FPGSFSPFPQPPYSSPEGLGAGGERKWLPPCPVDGSVDQAAHESARLQARPLVPTDSVNRVMNTKEAPAAAAGSAAGRFGLDLLQSFGRIFDNIVVIILERRGQGWDLRPGRGADFPEGLGRLGADDGVLVFQGLAQGIDRRPGRRADGTQGLGGGPADRTVLVVQGPSQGRNRLPGFRAEVNEGRGRRPANRGLVVLQGLHQGPDRRRPNPGQGRAG